MKIGIDLGGSHIAIGVLDDDNKIIEKIEKRILQQDKENICEIIETYIIQNVEKIKQKYKIEKIGISIPGTVNSEEIIKSVNLGLYKYNIVKSLQQKIDLPIQIRNDAKSAALAENMYGALKGYKRAIFLALGTGIGGAVIINNKLLDTGDLPGCEFGHMIIETNGRTCNCGKQGCFEKYSSMKSFKNNLRKELNLDETTRGQELINIINNSVENDDNFKKIQNVINEYIKYLSIGISNLINIFEPEIIGIGGSFVFFQDIFLEKIKKYIIENNLLFNPRKEIKIETAILNNDSGIIGSII